MLLTDHSKVVQQLVFNGSCFSCSVLSCCPLVFLSTICHIHLFLLISGWISKFSGQILLFLPTLHNTFGSHHFNITIMQVKTIFP